jgi:hypothetical protein
MLRRVQSLDLKDKVPELVQQTSYEIVRLNQLQLYSGFDSKGEKIDRKYKNKAYAVKKQQQNPLPGFLNPDLNLTGAFYQGFAVVVENYNYKIDSSDEKDQKLILAYGEDIFGLTGKNKGDYANDILFAALKEYIISKGVPIR